MLDKNDVRDVMLKECDICIHLFSKLNAEALDYRPTPKQRSTLELLRYLTHCGTSGVRMLVEGNYESFKAADAASAKMAAEEFPAAMARQKRELIELFDRITPQQFDTQQVKEPTGETVVLGRGLLDCPLRWLTAYRMQLFLYTKITSNADLWTPNCWMGADMARR
jgi:hypothetical protein